MNPTPRKMSDEDNALIQDYLNKGGKIEVKTPGARTEDIQYTGGFYQRRKKN